MRVSRRTFLKGTAAAGLVATSRLFADARPMPMRDLGRTGARVSLAGLGTAEWGQGLAERDADRMVARAIELGINYVDTAFSYGNGRAEEHLGRALKGRRDKVFLATKTLPRGRDGAMKELEKSLGRLGTGHVDLWQFHALATTRDTDQILRETEGALEAGLEARRKGLVRFLGITGHADPDVFVDALARHDFDTLLIPLNCIDPHHRSFEEVALPKAVERKTGVIAMKVFCSGGLVAKRIVSAEECLRYTYGLGISTCIVGCTSVEQVELAAHVARNLVEMGEEERAKVREKTRPHSPDLEWYKRK
ncbi:MAG: aldo/keto reductase [Planctomycetes bacterium]|nr:aldo/keto reductase [Planctomycetota bacterium]